MRSTVCAAPLVCRVPITRMPISAAVTAMLIVSRSRISPTRITSGSSRRAEVSAAAKLGVWWPTSRWLIRHFLRVCTNSMGSSIVTMCPATRLLISSMMAASVVDLPEPVLPVTRIMPWGCFARLREHRRQVQVLERLCLGRNGAEDRTHAAEVAEHVDAEPGDALHGVGEVGRVALLEIRPGRGRHDLQQDFFRPGRRQDFVDQHLQIAIQPHPRRLAGDEMQVRAALCSDLLQVLVDGVAHRRVASCFSLRHRSSALWWYRSRSG